MELKVLEGQNKNELSMIEVAHAILSERGDAMPFVDLANEVQAYLGDSDKEIRERLSQFYTDLNIDGSFISLGDNVWGLRTWYPFESIDEATVGAEEDEDHPKKKHKKVNAFLADSADDDDVIDYDDDDPEDQDDVDVDDDDLDADYDDDDDTDDNAKELGKYKKDLADIDDGDDDEDDDSMPDGIEGQLSEFNEDDDNFDDDDDDEESGK
ncbi:DNA-directed RNA polymerase subunit delta [Secundilactobacillus pentosiphilus]|uniref:Probable DNA-directed RNA polymerase subunit delta n=1 Tax=Secundilactobacillus pentosiphilus TaxID=1714682 RepID=A0A1Z5IS84_9LACO|nr:DNA-directed RNA polymerase subunit delta [Secundilactobacillus pentosiphilus]GAX04478.1 DNA-directed RNA polymerase subunit delta [Secundilactobacillus pentosiphilus]GAX06251.1 DNA-directed RNA polymerase subunit delta [Secundilactobacillus pentosiphilus]